jgi:hypothetical protein
MSEEFANYNLVLVGLPVRGRSCGSCTLCCTLLPAQLDDGRTKAGERCKHLCSKGCGIYPKRPGSCQTWSCRWLFDPATADLRRPDHVHYVIDSMPDQVQMTDNTTGEKHFVPVLQVWVDEKHRDAWRDPKLLDYLAMMGRKHGMATLLRFNQSDCLTVFPPALSSDGEWHEMSGTMNNTIGLYGAHPPDERPPL